MYSAVDIADHIVGRCAKLGRPVTNLQLQKILYYVQLNFLRAFDKYAFEDDILALRHGPAVKEVYYKYNIWVDMRSYLELYKPQKKRFQKKTGNWLTE